MQIPPHPLRRPLQVKEPEGSTRPDPSPFKKKQTESSLVQIAQCLFLRIILRIIATQLLLLNISSVKLHLVLHKLLITEESAKLGR